MAHKPASWERPRTSDTAEVDAGRRTAARPCHPPREANKLAEKRERWQASQNRVVPLWYYEVMAMNLRLDDEDSALLKALAEAEHVSLHEAALRAIRRSARELAHSDRVREATAEMLDRWGEVLDRLGHA